MFTALRDVQASCLHTQKFNIVSNKAYRELLLYKLYHKNVVCMVVDEAHCNVDWYVYNICIVDSNVLLSVSNGFITNCLQSGNNIVKER